MGRRTTAKRPPTAPVPEHLQSHQRTSLAFAPRRPHMRGVLDARYRFPRLWETWRTVSGYSRNWQARRGTDARGYTPEQAAMIRGSRLTLEDRRRMGIE